MAKKNKPNFKKKEPNSRKDTREEFAEEHNLNQAKRNDKQPNNQQNR
ncbi:hypothetical protein [Psychrobacillus lasiicapitis]|nr:hypothetical protein [Psychrobacillus lasiicapitis]GGA16679.1 hypothetical protein GCM10011384_02000 [Psychrobacillus lasiicapitis]